MTQKEKANGFEDLSKRFDALAKERDYFKKLVSLLKAAVSAYSSGGVIRLGSIMAEVSKLEGTAAEVGPADAVMESKVSRRQIYQRLEEHLMQARILGGDLL